MSDQKQNITSPNDTEASVLNSKTEQCTDTPATAYPVPETAELKPLSESDAPAAESFFLNSFNVDRLFRGIERSDYIFLYYIQMCKEEHPEQEQVYLAELAEAMHLNVTEISKAMEHLQDKGYVIWKTDAALGKTYVVFTTKTVELMADEKKRIVKCYEAVVQEIGMGELAGVVMTLKKIRDIINQTNAEME